MKTYKIKIAGLERELELFKVAPKLEIAAFIIFSDVEITIASAKELLKKLPEFDAILTCEAKSIPLAYEIARQSNKPYYVARKTKKVYTKNPISITLNSITTQFEQSLHLGEFEQNGIRGKRIVLLDDVISTGQSIFALERLAKAAGAEILKKACILLEGDSVKEEVVFLERLPLFEIEE